MRDLRIVFMGTPDFAVGVLQKLVRSKYQIVGIITATSFVGSGSSLTNLPASGDSNDITACLFI